eukprot:9261778-Pyramimonas_sp.AAC.1
MQGLTALSMLKQLARLLLLVIQNICCSETTDANLDMVPPVTEDVVFDLGTLVSYHAGDIRRQFAE